LSGRVGLRIGRDAGSQGSQAGAIWWFEPETAYSEKPKAGLYGVSTVQTAVPTLSIQEGRGKGEGGKRRGMGATRNVADGASSC
jgi:hypothetical protein